jgi:uncharacterized membrane protein YhaH (DUF805 family)
MSAPGTALQGWRWLRARARRREFWSWTLVSFAWTYLFAWADDPAPQMVVVTAFWLQVIRRLHDVGVSGWWIVAFLLTEVAVSAAAAHPMRAAWLAWLPGMLLLGGLISLGTLPGQRGENRFGPPPGGRSWSLQANGQPLRETFT